MREKIFANQVFNEHRGNRSDAQASLAVTAVIDGWHTDGGFNTPPPTRKTVYKWVRRAKETGSLANLNWGKPRHVVTNRVVRDVRRECVRQSTFPTPAPRSSCSRRPADFGGLSRSSYYRALKLAKLHAYKLKKVQKLNAMASATAASDLSLRMQQSEWLLRRSPRFFANLISEDEKYFTLHGMLNRGTHFDWMPYGSGGNPWFTHEIPVYSPKVMVVAAVAGNGLKLPLLFIRGGGRGNGLNSERYLRWLEDDVFPFLRQHHPGVPEYQGNAHARQGHAFWQQDGASCHTGQQVIRTLGNFFDGRLWALGSRLHLRQAPAHPHWQRSKGYVPRGPDFSVMDYWAWPRMKDYVYAHPAPKTMPELEQRIEDAWDRLSPEEIKRAFTNLQRRARGCVHCHGGHFEHLLRRNT